VTLIRRYSPLTLFVLAYGRSWIQERPLGIEASFPQAERAGGGFGEITEVFGARSSARRLATTTIKEV
jgi:hypothetical protein